MWGEGVNRGRGRGRGVDADIGEPPTGAATARDGLAQAGREAVWTDAMTSSIVEIAQKTNLQRVWSINLLQSHPDCTCAMVGSGTADKRSLSSKPKCATTYTLF